MSYLNFFSRYGNRVSRRRKVRKKDVGIRGTGSSTGKYNVGVVDSWPIKSLKVGPFYPRWGGDLSSQLPPQIFTHTPYSSRQYHCT